MPRKKTEQNLRVDRPPRKSRLCLKCGKTFFSDGPHNRLCFACNAKNQRETERYLTDPFPDPSR